MHVKFEDHAGDEDISRFNYMSNLGHLLLAHLSQRFIGELIHVGYSWSGVRPSSVRRPLLTISNIFFSETVFPFKAKFYVGASLGRGNESLFAASVSHGQDGRHAHIW